MKISSIPLGIYIHIPWCIKKCPYCDFNSHAVKSNLPEFIYIETLLTDLSLDLLRFEETRPVSHIFIGGGTPSLFSPEALDTMLNGIRQQIGFVADTEITLEANPGTFESEKFAEFRAIGINRLSIGIQSFDDDCLRRLGRVHSSAEAIRAAEIAHRSGFDNFNLDLMFGLPEAQPDTSLTDVATAIRLQPKHLSLYQFTLEPNTYFHKYPPHLPEPDAIVAEQLQCQQRLRERDFFQYEISAYAQPGYQCRHNLNYWQFGDYLGIGAGAHGKISRSLPDKIHRYSKMKSPEQYMYGIKQHRPYLTEHSIAPADLPLEFVMNHLRMRRGFNIATYRERTGLADNTLQPALAQCIERGLLQQHRNRYYCSEKGWFFLDTILQQFMPE